MSVVQDKDGDRDKDVDTILLDDGGAHRSSNRATSRHSLPWMKLIVPLDGARVLVDDFRRGPASQWCSQPVLTKQNVENLSAVEGPTWTFFFSPQRDGFGSHDSMNSSVEVVSGEKGHALIDSISNLEVDDVDLAIKELMRIIAGDTSQRELDSRVCFAATQLRRGELDGEALASDVSLSSSRLSHLFKEQLGQSMRSYALFHRLLNAFALKEHESRLVDVALGAGFSDQAHLTRTSRRFLGQPASYGGRVLRL